MSARSDASRALRERQAPKTPCNACGALSGKRCTSSTGKATRPHGERLDAMRAAGER